MEEMGAAEEAGVAESTVVEELVDMVDVGVQREGAAAAELEVLGIVDLELLEFDLVVGSRAPAEVGPGSEGIG